MKKRLLSGFLAFCLLLVTSPPIAFADEEIEKDSVKYSLNSTYRTATVIGYNINNFPADGKVTITEKVKDSGGQEYTVTSIGNRVFYLCTSLKDITIPSSVTSIGESAFEGCSGLTGQLTIPSSVTEIGSKAFSGCSGLTGSLTIPDGVKVIGNETFLNCSGLTGSLTIPSSVTKIGYNAFWGCSGLTGQLTIPSSVTEIGSKAFSGCSGLTSVTIPSSVTSIGSAAFSGCSKLTSITIPGSVTFIGNYVFQNCSNLKTIFYTASAVPSGNLGSANLIEYKVDSDDNGIKSVILTAMSSTEHTSLSCNAMGAGYCIVGVDDSIADNLTVGHNGGTATCTNKATCEVCGESYGEIDGDNHNYENPTWDWATDYSSAKAIFTCKRDSSHSMSRDATVSSQTIKEATCTEDGEITYTATVTLDGTPYTDTQTETVPALRHSIGSQIIAEVPATCTTEGTKAHYKCTREGCNTYFEDEAGNKVITDLIIPKNLDAHDWGEWQTTTPATCTEDGEQTRTCKTNSEHKETQTIPALEHDWGEPTFTWDTSTSGNWTAKATFTCTRDGNHTKTMDATVSSQKTKEATCTEDGEITYTATVTLDGNNYTDTQTETVSALGHDYTKKIIPPTPEKLGGTLYTCTHCGDQYYMIIPTKC